MHFFFEKQNLMHLPLSIAGNAPVDMYYSNLSTDVYETLPANAYSGFSFQLKVRMCWQQ
jgi:hypothetical protein